MTTTSLPEQISNGYRIQIRMKGGWKDSLTWPKLYCKEDGMDIAKMLNTSHGSEWRAVKRRERVAGAGEKAGDEK